MGTVGAFLLLYLAKLGAGSTLQGMSVWMTTLSELPLFFWAKPIIARIGVPGALAASLASFVVRFGMYAFVLPLLEGPMLWLVLFAESMHGVGFALFYSAAVVHANELAAPGKESEMQGMLGGFMSLGGACGIGAGGALVPVLWWQAPLCLLRD